MSVSFFVAQAPIIGFDLECVCGARYLGEAEAPMSEEVAMATLVTLKASKAGMASCEDDDCFEYGIFLKALDGNPDSPTINMANGNVRPVLEALGLAPDGADFGDICYGSLEPNDFLGRVLMALGVAPLSPERLAVRYKGKSEIMMSPATDTFPAELKEISVELPVATFIECGVPEGYVQTRLTQLLEVANFAVQQGREVCWS